MMGDTEGTEKQMRRRSRTVSWDHSVRSDGGGGDDGFRSSLGIQLPSSQGPTSPSLRDSSIIEFFDDDDMSISRGHSVEKGRFSASRAHSDENDEDYSASVNAILHKRLSVRKGKHQKQRRSSSPVSSMMPDDASLLSDRRRSSAFTTSSGDTAINIDDGGRSQEQILENIRLHKEVLGSVRQQPWSIRRKMKLVQQAKEYVKKHEGQLQERLAMSKSTRDILARFHIFVVKQWQHTKREIANFISQIIPWELTIKEIESQFGTVVASYFTFLRWLFWVNFVISVMLAAFVVIPEILTTNKADTGERKTLLPEEEATSMELMTLLNFEGVLQHSPIFYGYYSNRPSSDTGYRLPTAYFITGLVVYIYSFVATLRKMAVNSRLSKLSEKDDECIFTWKLFTGWDYMIGNEETAHNRISSIILGFKEALLEEAERMKDNQNWKIVALRIFANLNMIWMLGSSVYAVIFVVERSTEPEAESTFWRKYEITGVMTLIGTFFPIAFEILGVLESYHPRTTLRIQLARIMALNLLNLYTLTFALFVKINDMTKELLELKPNISNAIVTTALPKISTTTLLMTMALLNTTTTTTTTATTFSQDTIHTTSPSCYNMMIDCPYPPPTAVRVDPTTDMSAADTVTGASTNASTAATVEHRTGTTLPVTSAADVYTTDRSTTTGYVRGTSFDSDGGDDDPTFDPLDDKWTWTDGGKTTENDFITVGDLRITAVTVDYDGSSEFTAAEPDVSSTTYGTADNDTTTDSTSLEPTGSSFAESTDDFTTGTAESSTAGPTTSAAAAEPVTIPDTEFTPNANTRSVIGTTKNEPGDTVADEISAPKSRPKRTSDVIFDGTHCFQVVCAARSPASADAAVTKAPNGSPGFTDNSSDMHSTPTTVRGDTPLYHGETYATTTEHEDAPRQDLSLHATCLNLQTRRRLRKLCWETMFGQELVKLTVMDLLSTIISTIFVDFARAVFVRYMNRCWCWNLEKRFPQYGDFKIAENILHLVNNQGMVWMGMFFSPGLPIINVVKLMIMMYVRSWAVLTCNVPHDVVFRASRSNNFYLGLLLTMLFLCVLPVGYAIVWIEPSWHCGPFSQYKKIYHIFTNSIKKACPNPLVHRVLDYIASPAIVIPLLLLLILIIYYLASLTSSLREANNDLKTQLRRERTEERRKMFELVNRNKRGGGADDDDYTCLDSTLAKWRQIMPDNKLPTNGPNLMFGFVEKKHTENDVLDKVREKLVHMETDDQLPGNKNDHGQEVQHQNSHHHHYHHQNLHHHFSHRRTSRNEDSRETQALRKWKKSKAFVSRRPSSESDSSDQSEAIPEIRVIKTAVSKEPAVVTMQVTGLDNGKSRPPSSSLSVVGSTLKVQTPETAEGAGGSHKIAGDAVPASGGLDSGNSIEQPVKQRARLKLAQILYKEARRRRQKYLEDLQNQQE